MTRRTPQRTLEDLGEFGLIDRIERRARRLTGRRVRLGIGDDAALLRPAPGFELTVTADTAVEGVHFRFETASARSIGRRALVANLSDLAAMGARPIGFTCALQAPASLPLARVDALIDGLLSEAEMHGAPLVGGNVTRARETSLAITAIGEVEQGRALLRSGLRAGDRLYVTGRLGAAALAVARAEARGGRIRHLARPRLEAGRSLLRWGRCSACIDVSDGLAADLGHMLEASGVGADVDAARVPRARGLGAGARSLGLDPEALAFAGGEDYELVFGLRPGRGPWPSAAALARRLGTAAAEFGVVTSRRGLRGLPDLGGHTHF